MLLDSNKVKKQTKGNEFVLNYIKKYEKFIAKIAVSVCHKCPKLEVEDVKQQLILSLLTTSTYDESKANAFGTYFSQIVINASFNIIKKYWQYKNRVNAESVSLDKYIDENKGNSSFVNFLKESEESYYNPKIYANRECIYEHIETIKKTFNEIETIVFNYYMEGKNVAEMATLTKKSKKTIYNALASIREKLKHEDFY